jgi:hypothetical protein
MLLHQFILATVATVKRFEAELLGLLDTLRRLLSRRRLSREKLGESDFQET